MEPAAVRCEPTPNPNAMKFTASRPLTNAPRGQSFNSPAEALMSPLAARLLAIDGVASVFILRDFVTVTREAGANWDRIVSDVAAAISVLLDGS